MLTHILRYTCNYWDDRLRDDSHIICLYTNTGFGVYVNMTNCDQRGHDLEGESVFKYENIVSIANNQFP